MGFILYELFSRVADPITKDGCWLWYGTIQNTGYGTLWFGGRKNGTYRLAHRLMYQCLRGPIENGKVIDHLCRNRACVNPHHMEVVTNKENVLRGVGITANFARQTHCKHGHPLSGDNLYLTKRQRHCRTCRSNHSKRAREKKHGN